MVLKIANKLILLRPWQHYYMPPSFSETRAAFSMEGGAHMFDLECVLAFAKELPAYLDMFVRLCIELATHALGILNAM